MENAEEKRETIRYAVRAWGYLVPWGSSVTFAEFSGMIRKHYDNVRASAVAEVLASTPGTVSHSWQGYRANWQA
jgi:hypothetical protein